VIGVLRNPLSLHGTDLAPIALLIARMLGIGLIGQQVFPRMLPYLPLLESMGSSSGFRKTLAAASTLGLALLLASRFARLGCALMGGALLVSLFACRPCQSVAHTFSACALLVLALSSRRTGTRLLRLQVVVLYAGATLNKAFDPDWWNGRYFDAFLGVRHADALYLWLADVVPHRLAGRGLGIASIAIEAAIAVCLLVPRWHLAGVALAVSFHSVMVLWLGGTFGPFYGALIACYLAFLPWPANVQVGRGRVLAPDALPLAGGGLALAVEGRRFAGWRALLRWPLVTPLPYYALAAALNPGFPGAPHPRWVVAGLLAFLLAMLSSGVRIGSRMPGPAWRPRSGRRALEAGWSG
jgi:hypothetical protein